MGAASGVAGKQSKKGPKIAPIVKVSLNTNLQGGFQQETFPALPINQNLGPDSSHPVDCRQKSNSSGDALGARVEQSKVSNILSPMGLKSTGKSTQGASPSTPLHSKQSDQNLYSDQDTSEDCSHGLNTVAGLHEQRVQLPKEKDNFLLIGQRGLLGPLAGASLGETSLAISSAENFRPPPSPSQGPLESSDLTKKPWVHSIEKMSEILHTGQRGPGNASYKIPLQEALPSESDQKKLRITPAHLGVCLFTKDPDHQVQQSQEG